MDSASDLRARLLAEAMQQLETGEDLPSLRGLARAAGVSAMAPYRHFPDKAALLGAVAAEGFERLRRVLEEADSAGGVQALVAQGIAYIGFATQRPALFRLMFSSAVALPPERECTMMAYRVLERRVAMLVPEGAAVAALASWAVVHGLATLVLDGRMPAEPGVLRSVLERHAAGLAGR